jgi:hypothetical protein
VLTGIILDNFNQGRKRALWLSISNQLLEATRRDLTDLNAPHIELHQLNDWQVNEEISFHNGVIFCSYNTLISKSKITQRTRMQQLIDWLGEDGVVIFDECQRAQHALATDSGDATQTGLAVLELQDHQLRPDLRFIYSSATSVVEVNHLCYMDRLGLWGIYVVNNIIPICVDHSYVALNLSTMRPAASSPFLRHITFAAL